jgi:hypothetical protein
LTIPQIGVYLPTPTRDALNELGVRLSRENDSQMYNVTLIDGDKVLKEGGAYYYWIRERVFVQNPIDSVLHMLQPWNEENLDFWRQKFNNVPHRFNI